MPQNFKIKNSTEAAKVPAADDLQTAELAINLKDKKLYSKDADDNIFEVGNGDGRYLKLAASAGAQVVQSIDPTTFKGNIITDELLVFPSGATSYDVRTEPNICHADYGSGSGPLRIQGSENHNVAMALSGINKGTSDNAKATAVSAGFKLDGNATSNVTQHLQFNSYIADIPDTQTFTRCAPRLAHFECSTANFSDARPDEVSGFKITNSLKSTAVPATYGFKGEMSDTGNAYHLYLSGKAPNYIAGDTYIGGTTARNTFDLWKSTLTEEQLEQLEAGTLVAPANVATPGDGEFARAWYRDQQDTETQALLDSGELEYPRHLAAATFTGTFALGDNTAINLLSTGASLFRGTMVLEKSSPVIQFIDTAQAADEKTFAFRNSGGSLTVQALDDSGVGGGNNFRFNRAGTNVNTFTARNSGNAWLTIDNLNKTVTNEGDYVTTGLIEAGDGISVTGGETTCKTGIRVHGGNTNNPLATSANVYIGDATSTTSNYSRFNRYVTECKYGYDTTVGDYLRKFDIQGSGPVLKVQRQINPTVPATITRVADFSLALNEGELITSIAYTRAHALRSTVGYKPGFDNTKGVNGYRAYSYLAESASEYDQLTAAASARASFGGYLFQAATSPGQFPAYDEIGFHCRSDGLEVNALQGFVSEVKANAAGTNFNFVAFADAPSFFKGSTYIGGSTSRNTFDLWKSTLTEEQLEQVEAGALVAPANVSLPGNGEFARSWYYDQQDAETQAELDAGTLEYPAHLAAATFTDTFTLGDNTRLDLYEDGLVRLGGVDFKLNKTSAFVESRGIVYSSGKKALLSTNKPSAADENVDVFLARTDNTQYNADGTRTPLNIARGTSFKAESPIGNTAGEYGSYDSYVGFHASSPGNGNQDAVWTGKDNSYGFLSGVSSRSIVGETGQTYNFYASGSAPNYFTGLVEAAGGIETNDIHTSTGDFTISAPLGKVTQSSSDGFRFQGSIASEKGFEMVATVKGPYATDAKYNYAFFYPRVENHDGTDTTRLTELNSVVSGLYTGAVGAQTPYIKSKTGFLCQTGIGVNTWDDATEHVNYAFKSNMSPISGGVNWGFYEEGGVSNYMKGLFISSLSDTFTRKDATQAGSVRGLQVHGSSVASISINQYGTGTNQTNLELNRNGNPTAGPYITFFEDGVAAGSITCDSGGVAYNISSDYRLKESVAPLGSATEAVKGLNPVSFSYKTNPNYTHTGFLAHELQEAVPQSVKGTKDATEAIGTLADYDGTVLETAVPEPDLEDLTREEQIEVTPYIEPVEATYDEEGAVLTAAVSEVEATYKTVTRTKTWKRTGTQPVYQSVDPTKLIPLLTKALQEALERIEALEAAAK